MSSGREIYVMSDLINSPQAPDEVKVVRYEEQAIDVLPFQRPSVEWFNEQGVRTIADLEAWMKENGGDESITKAPKVGGKTSERVRLDLTHLRESYRVLEDLRSGSATTP